MRKTIKTDIINTSRSKILILIDAIKSPRLSRYRDECLNEEIFDTLAEARRKLALWRYDYNNVRPHSSLENQTPAEARRALEQSEGSAPGALAQPETDHYQPQGLSL